MKKITGKVISYEERRNRRYRKTRGFSNGGGRGAKGREILYSITNLEAEARTKKAVGITALIAGLLISCTILVSLGKVQEIEFQMVELQGSVTEIAAQVADEEEVDHIPTFLLTTEKFSDIVPLKGDIVERLAILSEDFDIPMEILLSIAAVESSYKPDVISSDGNDFGLFQINRINFKRFGLDKNSVMDPTVNATTACCILVEIQDTGSFTGWHQILMAYNMGQNGAKKAMANGHGSSEYSRKVLDYASKTFGYIVED